jgi:LacI family repressor for deo operon, udp, cdd, tsx, nupC, and nupG
MSVETHPGALHRSPQGSPRRVTLADVAKDAGVHKGTASRALRGLPGVDAGTRARVAEAARRLNYSASATATALATGRSHTVGLVLPTLRWWYFSEVAAGASEVLIGAGYRVELINLDVDSDSLEVDAPPFRELMDELGAAHGRDALLYAGTIARPGPAGGDADATVPAAVVGRPLTHVRGIYVDNRLGGRLVAQHLADLGHRHVAVLDGRMPAKREVTTWRHRTEGFLEVFPDALVLHPGDCHAVHGQIAMGDLLESGNPLPTAVFCHTDDMAFGAMATLRRAGLRCPDDMSVAAFDDQPMSQYWGLTTVTQHAHQQGVRAAAALFEAMNVAVPESGLSALDALQVELVVRETTAGPNR